MIAVIGVIALGGMAQGPGRDSAEVIGKWVVVGGEAEGTSLPPEATDEPQIVIFEKDRYRVESGGKVIERGTYFVYPNSKVNQIDLRISEGINAGNVQRGIFERRLGELRVCLNPAGESKRPDAFITMKGSGRLILAFKKMAGEP
jgi:uncharacterized protein (TIGR03067 family)